MQSSILLTESNINRTNAELYIIDSFYFFLYTNIKK